MNRARVLLAALVVGCMGSSAAAHDTWLQPRRTAVLPGTIAQIDLTSSDKFAAFDTAIKPERIEAARARLNGKTFDIPPGAPEKRSLELRVALLCAARTRLQRPLSSAAAAQRRRRAAFGFSKENHGLTMVY